MTFKESWHQSAKKCQNTTDEQTPKKHLTTWGVVHCI
jgi:hypothetical protein